MSATMRPLAGRLRLPACLLLAASVLPGCGSEPVAPSSTNLLLVTIDTLRADHLGLYRYERPTSPHLDRLAAESLVFERAYSVSSWTLPSIVSLMTALYPSTHACESDRDVLARAHQTLAERLSEEGFRTAAVTSHLYVTRRYQVDQGFDHFDEQLVREEHEASHEQITSPRISEKGIALLEELAQLDEGERWFLWLHYFDPHTLYQPHPGIVERFGEEQIDRYDGEILFTDTHIGSVLDRMRQLELLDRTLVVVTSDHGEEFREHGKHGHRASLYEEVLRIPLLIRVPGVPARRVEAPVSLVDLAPTVLQLLGVEPLEQAAGTSIPLVEGAPSSDRPPLLAELRTRRRSDWEALVDGRWKVIRELPRGKVRLYDLEADPGEQTNLARKESQRASSMIRRMERMLNRADKLSERFPADESIELSEQDLERLRGLGYAGDD